MNHPIVVVAFGTTSRARAIYENADERLKERFPNNDIHWAYNSRIVRHLLKKKKIELPTPLSVLNELASQGHEWATVQSYNMICGHEFHRIREDVSSAPIRVSVGHSLLCGPEDFQAVAKALGPFFEKDPDEAVVFVGHGTDHCSWSVYPAFEHMLQSHYGERAFVGMVEGDWLSDEAVAGKIRSGGFKRARLVPLMIVAGVHFQEDLAGDEDSWKTVFESQGIETVLEADGLGARPEIVDIFADHIQSALDVIPGHNDLALLGLNGEGYENTELVADSPERTLQTTG